MKKIEIFDKVSWHYPEGNNCPDLDSAKRHFIVIMNWLQKNNLLSDEGKEIHEIEVDSDFSLTSNLLTIEGNQIIKKVYSEWLKSINYTGAISTKILDNKI